MLWKLISCSNPQSIWRKYFDFAMQVDTEPYRRTLFAVNDYIYLLKTRPESPTVARILAFWEADDGEQFILLSRWEELNPTNPPSLAEFYMALDSEEKLNSHLSNEIFMTDSEVDVHLAHIGQQIRVYHKIPHNVNKLSDDEFLLRCKWDMATQSLHCLHADDAMKEKAYEGKTRLGPEYQAIIPDFVPFHLHEGDLDRYNNCQTESAFQPDHIWQPIDNLANSKLQKFIDDARAQEHLCEGMVVKFNTNRDAWARILSADTACPTCHPTDTKFIEVEIENHTVKVPRKNIMGHFSSDTALEVLFNNQYDIDAALKILSDPSFRYKPEMHWSEAAFRSLPKLRKAASLNSPFRKEECLKVTWGLVFDGGDENLDLSYVIKYGQNIVDPNRCKEDIMEFVLQCPLPGFGIWSNGDLKEAAMFSKMARIIQVALPPEDYIEWSTAIENVCNSPSMEEAQCNEIISNALSNRKDLQCLMHCILNASN